MEGWIRSFVTSYGLRVASYAPQRLVCNILTRNPERETRNASISTLQYSDFKHITDKSIYSTNGPGVKGLCQTQAFINGNTGSSGKI
jgi:hypothetical protein